MGHLIQHLRPVSAKKRPPALFCGTARMQLVGPPLPDRSMLVALLPVVRSAWKMESGAFFCTTRAGPYAYSRHRALACTRRVHWDTHSSSNIEHLGAGAFLFALTGSEFKVLYQIEMAETTIVVQWSSMSCTVRRISFMLSRPQYLSLIHI